MRLRGFGLGILLAAAFCRAADYPRPTGYVNDFASWLAPADRDSLERRLRDYEQRTSNEIAIAIVPSLQGESVEAYANGLFRSWGIGKKGVNNGVLFLWAPIERKVRIEVGSGLENLIPSAAAAEIVNNVTARFRRNQFAEGVYAAVDGIQARLDRQPAQSAPPTDRSPAEARNGAAALLTMAFVTAGAGAIAFLIVLYRKGRMRRLREEVPRTFGKCDQLLRDAEANAKQAGSDLQTLRSEAPSEVWMDFTAAPDEGRAALTKLRQEAGILQTQPRETYKELSAVHKSLVRWQKHLSETAASLGRIGTTLETFCFCRDESLKQLDPLSAALHDSAVRYSAGGASSRATTLLRAAQETYAKARSAIAELPPNWLQVHDLLLDTQECLDRIEDPGRWSRRPRSWAGSDDDSPAFAALAILYATSNSADTVSPGAFTNTDSGSGASFGGGDSGGFGGGDSGGGGASGSY
jgi:uncharacterized membrane protein YgcG